MQDIAKITSEEIEREKDCDSGRPPVALRPRRLGRPARIFLATLLICLVVPTTVSLAQETPKAAVASNPDNPLLAPNKVVYGFLKDVLLRSAERMPEEYYNFRPTWVVRSFGSLVGHVADTQNSMCAIVLGEKDPALRIEKTKKTKADLIAALKDSSAYCEKAYSAMTDVSAAQIVKFRGRDATKLFVLTANNMHTMEHYGNIIVYLRMKNILPPSSDPEYAPKSRANRVPKN